MHSGTSESRALIVVIKARLSWLGGGSTDCPRHPTTGYEAPTPDTLVIQERFLETDAWSL